LVVDSIRNASLYSGLSKGIAAGLKWLSETDLAGLELGRYELCCGLYAMVQDYETRSQDVSMFEAHRKYIDIQYVVSGRERMGYALLETLHTTKEYSADDDAILLSGDGSFLTLGESGFMIFMPQDAHMPGIRDPEASRVRKVVVKVPVE